MGGDQAIPKTFNNGEIEDEKTSVAAEAAYQELDEKAIERLQKIREEGLAKAIEEDEPEEALDTEEGEEKAEEEEKK